MRIAGRCVLGLLLLCSVASADNGVYRITTKDTDDNLVGQAQCIYIADPAGGENYILTCNHVVCNDDEYIVHVDDGPAPGDVDAGRITAWTGLAISVNLKPRDSGTYRLIDDHGETIATIDEDYVPNAAIPGSYGDYIELEIEADGKITNWKRPSFKEFFRKTD